MIIIGYIKYIINYQRNNPYLERGLYSVEPFVPKLTLVVCPLLKYQNRNYSFT